MLNLFRNGAVGFIDWLDGKRAAHSKPAQCNLAENLSGRDT